LRENVSVDTVKNQRKKKIQLQEKKLMIFF
jgi:hypothetical protein